MPGPPHPRHDKTSQLLTAASAGSNTSGRPPANGIRVSPAHSGDGNATANMGVHGAGPRIGHHAGRLHGSEMPLIPRHGLPAPGELESGTQVGGPNHGHHVQVPSGISEYIPGGGVYRRGARAGTGEAITPIIDPRTGALLGYRGVQGPLVAPLTPAERAAGWTQDPLPTRYQGGEYQMHLPNPIPRTGRQQPHRYPNHSFGDPLPEGFDPTHGPMGYPVDVPVEPYQHPLYGTRTTRSRGSWIHSGNRGLHWRPNVSNIPMHYIGGYHGTVAQQRAEQEREQQHWMRTVSYTHLRAHET